MTAHELRVLADGKWLGDQCRRLTNGRCSSRRCLERGGDIGGGPVDFDRATCEAKEISAALHWAAKSIDDLREALIKGIMGDRYPGDQGS